MKKCTLLIVALLCLTLFTTGCHSDEKVLTLGTYIYTASIDDICKPRITLEDNHKSALLFTAETPTATGTFEVTSDELIMKTEDGTQIFYFTIVDKKLVFNGEKSSSELGGSDIVDGAVFEMPAE